MDRIGFRRSRLISNIIYRLFPQENGYNFIVFSAVIIVQTICYAPLNSFGMIFNSYLEASTSKNAVWIITIVSGVQSVIISISGVIVNVALKRYSMRQVGIIGAVFITSGWMLMAFFPGLESLIFTLGVVQSFGVGLLTPLSFTCFNYYFIEKRFVLMCICNMIKSLGMIFFPFLYEYGIYEYGMKGTYLIISSIASHTIFAVLCMQKIKWQVREFSENGEVNGSLEFNPRSIQSSLFATEDPISMPEAFMINVATNVNSPTDQLTTSSRVLIDPNSKQPNIWSQLVHVCDLKLFSDPVFVILLLGISTTLFADGAFFTFYPIYLYSIGFTTSEVAWCIAILGASDLLCRVCLAIIGKYCNVKSKNVFLFGVFFTFWSRIPFFYCDSFEYVLVMTAVFGFLRGPLICSQLIFSEMYFSKFTAALGLETLTTGLLCTILFPILGIIQSYTDDYMVIFYILTATHLCCIIAWFAELIYEFNKKSDIDETTPLL